MFKCFATGRCSTLAGGACLLVRHGRQLYPCTWLLPRERSDVAHKPSRTDQSSYRSGMACRSTASHSSGEGTPSDAWPLFLGQASLMLVMHSATTSCKPSNSFVRSALPGEVVRLTELPDGLLLALVSDAVVDQALIAATGDVKCSLRSCCGWGANSPLLGSVGDAVVDQAPIAAMGDVKSSLRSCSGRRANLPVLGSVGDAVVDQAPISATGDALLRSSSGPCANLHWLGSSAHRPSAQPAHMRVFVKFGVGRSSSSLCANEHDAPFLH
mmetsp:Transcript_130358/g.329185  ORF Transcript_130358/g.329185 Transcript_130358/m.329185 type:complete len:270 (+) Transcript_130358:136-945(+)